jgi:hypothetical protein
MANAQTVFEALMRVKGYTNFDMRKGRYSAPNIQVRWSYFQMGWEMRGVAI